MNSGEPEGPVPYPAARLRAARHKLEQAVIAGAAAAYGVPVPDYPPGQHEEKVIAAAREVTAAHDACLEEVASRVRAVASSRADARTDQVLAACGYEVPPAASKDAAEHLSRVAAAAGPSCPGSWKTWETGFGERRCPACHHGPGQLGAFAGSPLVPGHQPYREPYAPYAPGDGVEYRTPGGEGPWLPGEFLGWEERTGLARVTPLNGGEAGVVSGENLRTPQPAAGDGHHWLEAAP